MDWVIRLYLTPLNIERFVGSTEIKIGDQRERFLLKAYNPKTKKVKYKLSSYGGKGKTYTEDISMFHGWVPIELGSSRAANREQKRAAVQEVVGGWGGTADTQIFR